MKVLLVAVNAQYIHTNLAVHSLAAYAKANGGLDIDIAEYTINHHQDAVLQELYEHKADVIAFSCYIWNIDFITQLAANLRKIQPSVFVLGGGPQISYGSREFLKQNPAFDALILGEGEQSFLAFVQARMEGGDILSTQGVALLHKGEYRATPLQAALNMDELPFVYTDIAKFENRILYYESMRGCPFSCSYCLSSVERGVRIKSNDIVLKELFTLLEAQPKQVKFVDRTFNCNKAHAMEIWRFLAQHDNGKTNFHFELAGELLDEEMLLFLQSVRPGLFQFEIGVQSTNVQTLAEISRPADLPLLFANIDALKQAGNIHLHLDLIAGLPCEGFDSFAKSFNQLYAQRPHQLQLGILKMLPGSGMLQNAQKYGMVWQQNAPFEVLSTSWLQYPELALLKQIAGIVDLYYNSGRFTNILEYLCARFDTPFVFYERLARFYHAQGFHLHALSKIGQYELLGSFMQSEGLPCTPKAQWLCKYDLCLHEKIRALPSWVQVDDTAGQRYRVLSFYQDEDNIQCYLPHYAGREAKQIYKMAHIEVFPFCPPTGEEHECALLFDYAKRDIAGRAKIYCVTLPLTER